MDQSVGVRRRSELESGLLEEEERGRPDFVTRPKVAIHPLAFTALTILTHIILLPTFFSLFISDQNLFKMV